MGFSRSQSEAAIKKYGSVQAGLDSLLTGVGMGRYNSAGCFISLVCGVKEVSDVWYL